MASGAATMTHREPESEPSGVVVAARLITDFLENTILGFEKFAYKHLFKDEGDSKFQSTEALVHFSKVIHEQYFNRLHKGLILKDDAYVTKAFGKFHYALSQSSLPHSSICLLNIMIERSLAWHQQVSRQKCNLSNLVYYAKSVFKQLRNTRDRTLGFFERALNHKCTEAPLPETYDRSRPMFKFGEQKDKEKEAKKEAKNNKGNEKEKESEKEETKNDSKNLSSFSSLVVACANVKCKTIPSKKLGCPCKMVAYCSKKCQKQDWKSHRPYHEKIMKSKVKAV